MEALTPFHAVLKYAFEFAHCYSVFHCLTRVEVCFNNDFVNLIKVLHR